MQKFLRSPMNMKNEKFGIAIEKIDSAEQAQAHKSGVNPKQSKVKKRKKKGNNSSGLVTNNLDESMSNFMQLSSRFKTNMDIETAEMETRKVLEEHVMRMTQILEPQTDPMTGKVSYPGLSNIGG